MNTETNHLIDISEMPEKELGDLMKVYTPVPDELNRAAGKALNGKNDVYVSRNSGGKLSNWAKSMRKKKKSKRKGQNKSRKSNRNKS